MRIESRENIRDLILYVEDNFPINEWKINDVHLWPFLRIKLYMSLVFCIEKSSNNFKQERKIKKIKSKNLIADSLDRMSNKIDRIRKKRTLEKWFKDLPEKDNLFLSFESIRVPHNGKLFDRFFDVFIEENALENNYVLIDSGDVNKNHYNFNNIVYFKEQLDTFIYTKNHDSLLKSASVNLNGYIHFLSFLKTVEVSENYSFQYDLNGLNKLIAQVLKSVTFFQEAIKKIKPKVLYTICYYSQETMCLLIAANKAGVKTIEYQHGPQSDLQLAYSNWSKVPTVGYDSLPRVFWNWDKESSSVIKSWSQNSDYHDTEIIGNFWINYWKKKDTNSKYSDYILYSLQPTPVTKEELFPSQLINFIKNNNFKWFCRFHPRQSKDIPTITNFLKKEGIFHLVELGLATSLPLPVLLANCKLHITHFSGTTIEAAEMGKFTILINKLGCHTFQNLVNENKAAFIDINHASFEEVLFKYLNKCNEY